MSRNRTKLQNRRQRPVLSDTLPFELPVAFTNRHFFEVLVRYNVHIVDESNIKWECDDDSLDDFIYLVSGVARTVLVVTSQESSFGKLRNIRKLSFTNHNAAKVPFGFEICHRANEARTLSVPHPFSQICVANFYNDHADSIIYYASRSPFSIRRPDKIARYSNFRDRLHERLISTAEEFEQSGREYGQMGSFFSYHVVNNVFKFFESYRYHRAEKKFDAMAQIDISKCFDSIYTHSAPWAVHGKSAVKDDLGHSKATFAGKFDRLMQSINQNETNGIIIGPEFSRVFAEIILQSVDRDVETSLFENNKLTHKRDYQVFRYVDDYFVFYNNNVDLNCILDTFSHYLTGMKLSVNKTKTKVYEKPVITEITIAKSRIASFLQEGISSEAVEINSVEIAAGDDVASERQFKVKANSRELIVDYKTILKTSNVSYLDVGNYSFAMIESAVDRVIVNFSSCLREPSSDAAFVRALSNILEFTFFVYAACPRVNLSIRLTRLISVIVRALRRLQLSHELKHLVFKYINDNVVHQLRKNEITQFKEVESLYLLNAIGMLGREYWLDEISLCKHLGIKVDTAGELYKSTSLSVLTITVVLGYVRNRTRYAKLRTFISDQIERKISARVGYITKETEILVLFLDTVTCPYIADAVKDRLAGHFGLSATQFSKLKAVSNNWFTTWEGLNLAKELDAKRYRDVY